VHDRRSVEALTEEALDVRAPARFTSPASRDIASVLTGTPSARNSGSIESAGSGDSVTTTGSKSPASRWRRRFRSCVVGPARRSVDTR
jgi:hypothetical protein